MLKVVENDAGIASDAEIDAGDHSYSGSVVNISTNHLVPYRLTEQFRINVQKDDEPSVRFYSVLFVDLAYRYIIQQQIIIGCYSNHWS